MSYEAKIKTYGRTRIDWSDPEDVKLRGYDHGKIELISVHSINGEDDSVVVAIKEAAGTHFVSLGERAYHSPQITVYFVEKPEKGDKGWGLELINWKVTRKKKSKGEKK